MRRDFYPVWRDFKKSFSRRSTNSKNLISESLSLISPTADLVEHQWSSLSAEIFCHNQHESRFYQLYFMAKLALKALNGKFALKTLNICAANKLCLQLSAKDSVVSNIMGDELYISLYLEQNSPL